MRRERRAVPTVVEVMIVIAIGLLFILVVLPNLPTASGRWNQRAAIGNLRALLTSLEMYRPPAPSAGR